MSESKVKEARRQAIAEHVHCRECQRAVPPDKAKHGGALTPIAAPNGQGIAFTMRPVPLCPACFQRIQENERKAAGSRLIVPQLKAQPTTAGVQQ